MTKRHFIAIAALLKANREVEHDRFYKFGTDEPNHLLVDRISRDMADYFAVENPRFDRERFLAACGVE